MTSISLPEFPRGREFEEYISAFFQSGGYYVERNIIERDVEEILELDIITTNYNLTLPEVKLLEIKSGEWGFHDLFKIRGWMDYLGISKGVLITSTEKSNNDFYKEKAKLLEINLLMISDLNNSRSALSEIINTDNIDDLDIKVWRYSYWVERNLLKRLKHKKKSCLDKKCYKALEEYYDKVNNGLFFIEGILPKVSELYSAFQEYRYISAKCGNELVGNDFNETCDILHRQLYEDTYYKCIYNDIQISTFIEHRARLALLKNLIDYKQLPSSEFKEALDTLLDLLPSSFRKGLDTISQHEYYHKYPIFWQWFFWIFGGFILKDYEEKEYEILSKKTGIPKKEIPNALESYQILFPRDDGWFLDLSPNSNIKMMKMFSIPFMGIGAYYRILLYPESQKYEDLKLTGIHTLNDLIKWNNLMVEVLKN